MGTIIDEMLALVQRRERKPRPPRARDEAIYAEVRVRGRTQAAVADERGLSQPRVSQIVKRVEAWRRSAECEQEALEQQAAQRQVDRALDRQRLEEMYLRGLRAQDRAERDLTSQRSGERDGKPWSEKSSREQPASVQGLKTAMRAIELRWKLDEQPQGTGHRKNDVEKLGDTIQQLHYLRRCAIAYGHVRSTEQPEATVQRLLVELVGAGQANRCEAQSFAEPNTASGVSPDGRGLDRTRSRGGVEEGERAYMPEEDPAQSEAEVQPAPSDSTSGVATSSAAASERASGPPAAEHKPKKGPNISDSLTAAQREARRKLLPRFEWTIYDEQGNFVQRS